jgi:hypothetical protein
LKGFSAKCSSTDCSFAVPLWEALFGNSLCTYCTVRSQSAIQHVTEEVS